MKKVLTLVAAVAALASFNPVEAVFQEGPYLGVRGGANFVHRKHHNHYRTGYAVGGLLGYGWCNGLRLEVEGTYRHNAYRHSRHRHLTQWAGMANVIYDFNVWWGEVCDWNCLWDLTPYVGAGIGYSHQRVPSFFETHHNTGFAWQLIAGFSYAFEDCFNVDLDYRFFKGHFEGLYNHTLTLGLRYTF